MKILRIKTRPNDKPNSFNLLVSNESYLALLINNIPIYTGCTINDVAGKCSLHLIDATERKVMLWAQNRTGF